MNNNRTDVLLEFEETKGSGNILNVVVGIYAFQIVAFTVFHLWPFSLRTLLRAKDDSEFHLLATIHIVYPIIALIFFRYKPKIGWIMMVFGSMINVVFAVAVYGEEMSKGDAMLILLTDRMILFFIVYGVLTILLFRRSLLLKLNVTRKFLMWTVGIAAIPLILFLTLLVVEL